MRLLSPKLFGGGAPTSLEKSLASILYPPESKTFYCHCPRPANSMSQPELTRSIVGANFILPVINGAMHIPPAVSATRVTLGDSQPVDVPILVLLFALHVLIDGELTSPSNTVQNRKLTFYFSY